MPVTWGLGVFYLDALPQQALLVLLFTPMVWLIGGQFQGFSSVRDVMSPPHTDPGTESQS